VNSQEAALNKAPDAFRTISEVADELDLPQHVLRFWESRFPHIRPMKRGGGRRYYRPEDIDLLRGIRRLLYGDGYTIRGVQRILREQGVRTVQSVGQGQAANLLVPPPNDGHDESEPNGTSAALTFPSAGDETEEQEFREPELSESPLQNRPVMGINSVVITPGSRVEAAQVGQAPIPDAVPSPRAMAAHDMDRLRHALAELEACRRLLDKANEGGQ
jgi:DNA-binding transcriptional MerR regulator